MNRILVDVQHWKFLVPASEKIDRKRHNFSILRAMCHRQVALRVPLTRRRTVSRALHRVLLSPRAVRCGRKAVSPRLVLFVAAASLLACNAGMQHKRGGISHLGFDRSAAHFERTENQELEPRFDFPPPSARLKRSLSG